VIVAADVDGVTLEQIAKRANKTILLTTVIVLVVSPIMSCPFVLSVSAGVK
jgi:hypothetical protein